MNKKFDFTTINDFDGHISSSIKGYDVLHQLIITMSSFFIRDNSTLIDVGCTSGKLLNSLATYYSNSRVNCIGYDITDVNFIESSDKVRLIKQDVTDAKFAMPRSEIVYLIFTLQFLPIDSRQILLDKIYKSLRLNGALFICEKEICHDGRIQEVFTFSNYDYKRNSFTCDDILTKEVSLRSVMNPLPVGRNVDLLREVGFTVIEQFFQSLNFRGYLCLK
jgi:tRNA (cmo5U34)-methyltransferase